MAARLQATMPRSASASRGGGEPPEGSRPRAHQDCFSPYTRWYSCHECITRFTNARVSL